MYLKLLGFSLVCLSLSLSLSNIHALSFDEAMSLISKHDTVKSLEVSSKIEKESALLKSSWGDPSLKIAAKNFPKDSLDFDQTPMTGVEFNLSQKIPLTTKYGKVRKSKTSISQSIKYDSIYQNRSLKRKVWTHLINTRRLKEEVDILKSNLSWISKMLKVTKKLYANGRATQQALLELQIRKSELDVKLDNISHDLSAEDEMIFYIIGKRERISSKTIPWQVLEKDAIEVKDVKELSLKSKVSASESYLSSKELAIVPDLTVSLGYTKRSNIDSHGDFVSASISFPLPFSDTKYSDKAVAIHTKSRNIVNLNNYRNLKKQKVFHLQHKEEKISSELNILSSKTIKFAENSRKITSKSYSLGSSSYVELLQSELKLQKLLIKRSRLNARLSIAQINRKFLLGENLHE
jgi:outer membrane protein TolC